jgi:hypothetical protein
MADAINESNKIRAWEYVADAARERIRKSGDGEFNSDPDPNDLETLQVFNWFMRKTAKINETKKWYYDENKNR